MSDLVYVEHIKVPDLAEPLEVMFFDDASIVMMHTNTSKNNEDFPINFERWEYDYDSCDYFVRGSLAISESLKHESIRHLVGIICNIAKQQKIFRY